MFYKTPEPPTSVFFTPAGIDIFDKRQKPRWATFYKTSESSISEPFIPGGIDIIDKRQKLRCLTLYNTLEPRTPELFTLLEDKIAIFQQTSLKEAIPLPELCFINAKLVKRKWQL